MINKTFDKIEKSDIDALIESEIPEGKTIEYKESLPGGREKDKKEFLADVSSFANAAGGDLLYGIKEKREANGQSTGIPEEAKGLQGIVEDQEILRLEEIIREGIELRIPGIQTRAITGFADGPVILLRIPKSWASPHMVTFQRWSRFYSRTSNGKYQLDVSEIRSAFALSESIGEKIRQFRDERIAKIISGDTPIPLSDDPKVILHLVPIASLESINKIDIKGSFEKLRGISPIYSGGWNSRFNFDGVLNYSENPPHNQNSYFQYFRNGTIEAVSSCLIRNDRKGIPNITFEEKIIEALKIYIQLEKLMDLPPPFVLFLSLTGIKGFYMAVSTSKYPFNNPQYIEKNDLFLPDILIDEVDSDASQILQPIFDIVWQSFGWEQSINYDESGNWIGK